MVWCRESGTVGCLEVRLHRGGAHDYISEQSNILSGGAWRYGLFAYPTDANLAWSMAYEDGQQLLFSASFGVG